MDGFRPYSGKVRPALLVAILVVGVAVSFGLIWHVGAVGETWTSRGPAGVDVQTLRVSPSWVTDQTIFLGTLNAVWETHNAGGGWTQTAIGTNNSLQSIAFSPAFGSDGTAFVAGTNSFWVHYTTNWGASWTESSTAGISGDRSTWDIAVSPGFASDSTLFVAGNNRVHKSTDRGLTFTASSNGLPTGSHLALAISPAYTSDQTVFVGTFSGVYKSTNGGGDWTALASPAVVVMDLAISPNFSVDRTLFACVVNEGVFRSTNGGATWVRVNSEAGNFSANSLAISPAYAADQTVFIGTEFGGGGVGILVSQDGGDTWARLDNAGIGAGTLTYPPPVAVTPDFGSDRTVFTGTTNGVYSLALPDDFGYISGQVLQFGTTTPIPNVTVRVSPVGEGGSYTATTDANGNYRVSYLPAGCYFVQAIPLSGSGFQISRRVSINLALDEGREMVDFDLPSGAASLGGNVSPSGEPVADTRLEYENEALGIELETTTDGAGNYAFANLPPGAGFLRLYVPPGSTRANTGRELSLSAGSNTESFALADEACVTGRVLDQNGAPVGGALVDADSARNDVGTDGFTNGSGEFSLCNLPDGIISVGVESGPGSGFCGTQGKSIYLNAGETRAVGDIRLQRCTTVQGAVASPDPDNRCGLDVLANGYDFQNGGNDVEMNVYQLQLPAGVHTVFLDLPGGNGPSPLAAKPVQVTVTQAQVNNGWWVTVPETLQVYSAGDSAAGVISGSITKSFGGGYPAGEFVVAALPAGASQAVTAEAHFKTATIQEVSGPASSLGVPSFTMQPVPPGTWDVAWAVYNESPLGVESVTILDWRPGVAVAEGAPVSIGNFDYAAAGSPVVDGYVYDTGGNPVVGARVLIASQSNTLRGFAETDQNGYWVVYHLPAGTSYTARASSPFLSPSPGQDSRMFDAVEGTSTTVASAADPLRLNPAAGTPGTISGTVRSRSGGVSLDGVQVVLFGVSFDQVAAFTWTGAGGTYTLANLPAGGYRVAARGGSLYANQFFNDSPTWEDAAPVTVAPGANVTGVEFNLDPGGQISGIVRRSSDNAALEGVQVIARDAATGKWVGRSDLTSDSGVYVVGGLPAGSYHLEVEYSGYRKEYYNSAPANPDEPYHKAFATPVTVTAGATTPGIDFSLETRFTVNGSIKYIHKSDGGFQTWVEAEIGTDFTGALPGGISAITLRDPAGNIVANAGDFAFQSGNPEWRIFSAQVASPPALGVYTFTVTGANGSAGAGSDYQYILRSFPVYDNSAFSPANDAVVDSKTPIFTWTPIDYPSDPDMPIYYRLEIYTNNTGLPGTRVYASDQAKGHDKLFHTLKSGILTPGQSYLWRVRAGDSGNWITEQNRTDSGWLAFTAAAPIPHSAKPALDPKMGQAYSYNRENGTIGGLEVRVIDLDGIAFDGSSHTVQVQVPGNPSPITMPLDVVESPTQATFWASIPGVPPAGVYTFTVTDPELNTATIADTLNVDVLAPPDRYSITPTLKNAFITAVFDNISVNGSFYESFDGYASVNDLNRTKWPWNSDSVVISGGALLTQVSNSIGRGDSSIGFANPNDIHSIEADVTVTAISDSLLPRARIAGTWFSTGKSDVFASLSVYADRVAFSVSEQWLSDQNTWRWKVPVGGTGAPDGTLLTGISPGQTIRCRIALSGSTLTFSADGATAQYTHPSGAVYPPSGPDKTMMSRIHLTTGASPTFTWAPVDGAVMYRVRIYNRDSSETLWRGYTEGAETFYRVPPGVLKTNSYYRYRLDAFDARNPHELDNYARTPVNSSDFFIFYTDDVETEAPYIELDNLGAYTRNGESIGEALGFWVYVHDAQGVPGNIQQVTAIHPGGFEETLTFQAAHPHASNTATRGVYATTSTQPPVDGGKYKFRVQDLQGHTYETSEEELTSSPLGFALESSLVPVNGASIAGTTAVGFDWADVPGALFYQVNIYDYGMTQRLNIFYTFESEFQLPEGFLALNQTYRWRVHARRELFQNNVDNQSYAPGRFSEAFAFTLGTPPDSDGDGMPDFWEDANGLNRGANDAALDPDGDGLTNLQEYQNATNPQNIDSDGDGSSDLYEVQGGTDPNDPGEVPSLSAFFVNPSGSDLNLGDEAHPLKTLHKAVARVNDLGALNSVINMSPGTYTAATEGFDTPVTLGQSVTVVGNGAVLDGAGAAGWAAGLALSVGAEKVTLQNLTIRNFKKGLEIQSDGGCVTLTGVTISACGTGVELAEAYQLDIDLSTSIVTGCGTGVKVSAGSANTTLRNGEVRESAGDGIRVERSNEVPDQVHFENIQVRSNAGHGIVLYDGSGHTVTGCELGGNNSSEAALAALAVFSTCTVASHNSIEDNQCAMGLYADEMFSTSPVDARYNWWGSADGPSGAGPGTGETVSDGADFHPWLGMTPSQDTDQDGLPDTWEQANFGGLGQTGTGDFDGDGWSNLAEHQAGTDPKDRDAAPAVVEFLVAPFGQDHNLGNASHPLQTLHGAVRRVNGIAEGSYVIRLSAGVYSANALAADVIEPNEPVVIGANVTIAGAGQGATVLDGAGVAGWSAGLTMASVAERVTLENLTIRNFERGLAIQSDGGCFALGGVVISACGTGIELAEAHQLDLDLADSVVTDCGTGVKITAGSANLTLRNGEVRWSADDGIRVERSNQSPDQVRLEGLLVFENAGHGIALFDGAGHSVTDCSVIGNNTGRTGWGGLAVFTACTRVNQNAIEGNGCVGLYADDALSTAPLDAAFNWWGHDSGPFHATANPAGTGDAIGDHASFEPWLGYTDCGGYVPMVDTDNDGLLDPWEDHHFGGIGIVDGSGDADGDGLTNAQEQELGYNPASAVDVLITTPVKNPFYTGGGATAVTLAGTCRNAGALAIRRNGVTELTLTAPASPWSASVPVLPGSNAIEVVATEAGGTATTKAGVTVVVDNQAPSVSIELPTPTETYTTSLVALALGGMAADNSGIAEVSWTRTAATEPTATGSAAGTTSWTTAAIPIVAGAANVVTVTVEDFFGNQASSSVTITREPAAVNESSAPPTAVAPPLPDPLDLDGDNYQNEDETACGSDPYSGASVPANFLNSFYPGEGDPDYNPDKLKRDVNGTIIGYLWPDCLNPDDDLDKMPDAWESQYGLDPHDPTDAGQDPDGDGNSNQAEFQNGTDPTVAPTMAFGIEVFDVTGQQPYGNWLPGYGRVLEVRATWQGDDAPANLLFALKNTSAYPGRAVNDPNPAELPPNSYADWYQYSGPDFGLTLGNPATNQNLHSFDQGPITVAGSGVVYTAYLQCWDYGGRTRLVVSHPADASVSAEVWIPIGSGANGIGSAWEHDRGTVRLDPNADRDALIFIDAARSAPLGDDFNNFEEYRGVVYTTSPGGALEHLRMNPGRKDLFVRTENFDAVHPFAMGEALAGAGVVVHDTTGWGHDATEGGGFFRYYRAGTISEISEKTVNGNGTGWGAAWPGQEWEFRLAADSGSEAAWTPVTKWLSPTSLLLDRAYAGGAPGAYEIRMSMPHINVLLVRLDKVKKGVFTGENGRLIFLGASPPSPENPTGSRHWSWTTKGHARESKDPASYGIAEVLQIPLDHYFADRPYKSGTVWDPVKRVWEDRSPDNHRLMPLSRGEDPLDAMAFIDGFNDLGLGLMVGNLPNGTWDGDRRLQTQDEWNLNSNGLTPFDIDGDGRVELPASSDPGTVDPINQYTKARVLKHSITHEICHILAKTAWHSTDSSCVMYMYSNNWRRDDHLSDEYRELLEIHNKRR